jgi:hypothetical protein
LDSQSKDDLRALDIPCVQKSLTQARFFAWKYIATQINFCQEFAGSSGFKIQAHDSETSATYNMKFLLSDFW